MRSKCLLPLMIGIVLVSTAAGAQTEPSPNDTVHIVVGAGCVEALSQATSVDLAQAIAQVEVERILLGVKYFEAHPTFASLNERQSTLEACLNQLQPNDSQDLIVTSTIGAIASQLVEFETLYIDNQRRYHDSHPEQQFLRMAIEALHQHLATLQ